MSPTPSESILIIRIVDALTDSGKTALGISNYIKAKFYRVETTHEIITVIRKYLLDDKVLFEPIYGLYRLRNKNQVFSCSNLSTAIRKSFTRLERTISSVVNSTLVNDGIVLAI